MESDRFLQWRSQTWLKEHLGLFYQINKDEDLLVDLLIQVKRLDGDLFVHIYGQRQTERLNGVIARDFHGGGQKEREKGRRTRF